MEIVNDTMFYQADNFLVVCDFLQASYRDLKYREETLLRVCVLDVSNLLYKCGT